MVLSDLTLSELTESGSAQAQASVFAAATGVALLLFSSLACQRLLFGEDLTAPASSSDASPQSQETDRVV
jgi:hypothetical protein